MAQSLNRLAAVPGYLQRIEAMAGRLARFNLILDAETRADIVYIQRYAAEARVAVELELRDKTEPPAPTGDESPAYKAYRETFPLGDPRD